MVRETQECFLKEWRFSWDSRKESDLILRADVYVGIPTIKMCDLKNWKTVNMDGKLSIVYSQWNMWHSKWMIYRYTQEHEWALAI